MYKTLTKKLQETPWFREGQAEVKLNMFPLKMY